MKTPREILFHRHRAAEAKLDALTRVVVAQLEPCPTEAGAVGRRSRGATFLESAQKLRHALLHFSRNFWLEVIWTPRRIWGGLAAVWLLILVANLDFHAGAPSLTASISPNTAGFLIALHEPEEVMSAFAQPPAPQKAGAPKPPAALPPRSARRLEFRII